MQLDSLVERARERAGIADELDGCVIEPLQHLLNSYLSAGLNPIGRRIVKVELTRVLVQRLRFQALRKEAESSVPGPSIVIFGLPRTGSTLLQYLLSSFSDTWTPNLTQSLEPFPGDDSSAAGRAQRHLDMIYRRAPELETMHPMAPSFPEECITLQQITLLSHRFEVMSDVREYSDWRRLQPHSRAYAEYADVLGLMWSQRQYGISVLKAPAHLRHLSDLTEAFPGAILVETHRDPVAALFSYCRLVRTTRKVLSDDPRQDLVAEIAPWWSEAIMAAAEWRSAHGSRVIHVGAHELLSDPASVVSVIRAAANLACETEDRSRIARLARSFPGKIASLGPSDSARRVILKHGGDGLAAYIRDYRDFTT